jgi:hypothetical protein
MDDKSFDELKLKMTIVPEQARWPEPKFTHWEKLHSVANEARSRVAKAYAALDEIDRNPDLTPEGKAKARAKLAEQVVADFCKSETLEKARSAVANQMQRWNAKVDEHIKPAEDPGTAATYMQIRDHLNDMKEGRWAFIDKHISDPVVVSAIFTGPAFLSGLSDVELGLIRQKIAQRVLSPEVAEAKAAAEKAMLAAEKGWARAVEVIAQRGGPQRVKAKAA